MRSPAFPPRRPSHLVRYIFPSALLLCLIYYLSHTGPEVPTKYVPSAGDGHQVLYTPGKNKKPSYFDGKDGEKPIYDSNKDTAVPTKAQAAHDASSTHPIDSLIKVAEADFTDILAKESSTLAEAAEAYRKRRGRHPPPGFKAWYEFAKGQNAVIVEDFWDQVYHDLNPFWGVDASQIRKDAWDFEMTINVRNGNASAGSDWFWTQIWLDLIKTVEGYLPDMDIALNAMDEPRLVVPWEDINGYMQKEKKSRTLVPPKQVISEFSKLPSIKKGYATPETREPQWEDAEPYWLVARRGCAPDSQARTASTQQSFDKTPNFIPSYATAHQYQGFVSNSSLSREFCHQPDLQGLEGIFIKPLTTSATKILLPMFGGSKLATNNEILLPAPMYWNEEERFTGGDDHGDPWDQKLNSLIWRGVATGGRNNESNWKGFQRHRFVSMNNGTKLTRAEGAVEPPVNFVLPTSSSDQVAAQKDGRLGQWVQSFTDVGFTDLFCDEKLDAVLQQDGGRCFYTDPHYDLVLGRTLAEQFDYKYLPDIDGNSFSGRYLGFLRSTSLPIKSTLWREWHDSRLVAWKHFVPMDNRFGDYYGILEYFLGYGDKMPAHDAAAQKIALDGKKWAEKVLRKEDMQVYVLRLLLEYARVSDPRREEMGWVEDLL
ncbi:glycosyltransferase family 90 protein [Xylariales sp. AK1849]|nr:glycosyltransferase family 90 protein [Xylariales sp. AK1849]